MTEDGIFVAAVGNQCWVPAIVVQNVNLCVVIINHVQNYPLGCTIPCTHYILLFFLTNTLFILKRKKRADAKSVMNLATNTLIAVTVATSTFTSNVLFWNLKLNSMITH